MPGFENNDVFDIESNRDSYQFTNKDFEEIEDIIDNLSVNVLKKYKNSHDLLNIEKLKRALKGNLNFRKMVSAGFYLLGKFNFIDEGLFRSTFTVYDITSPVHIESYLGKANLTEREFFYDDENQIPLAVPINREFFGDEPEELVVVFPKEIIDVKRIAENVFTFSLRWINSLLHEEFFESDFDDLISCIDINTSSISRAYYFRKDKIDNPEPKIDYLISSSSKLEMIRLYNLGMTSEEIGESRGVEAATVDNYMREIRLSIKNQGYDPEFYIPSKRKKKQKRNNPVLQVASTS